MSPIKGYVPCIPTCDFFYEEKILIAYNAIRCDTYHFSSRKLSSPWKEESKSITSKKLQESMVREHDS